MSCVLAVAAILAWPVAVRGEPAARQLPSARSAAQEAPAVTLEPAARLQRLAARDGPSPLLAVPYLAQEELLCGGAAAAMVIRYWGARQEAAAYAHLIDRDRHGIPTDDLVNALRGDRWRAIPFAGSAGRVQDQLDAGRPVIALIEVRPGRYHYVVLLAWSAERVVLHDPAVGPYRVLAATEFERAWAVTGRWSLLVLPRDGRASAEESVGPADSPAAASGDDRSPLTGRPPLPPANEAAVEACAPLLIAGIEAARAGDAVAAEARLRAAMAACPTSPAAPRELAGLRFRQERWQDAAKLARRSLELEPTDRYTRRLLASARFLAGDRDGALDDWNRLLEPRIDLVDIQGLRRTRHPVVGRMLGLGGGDLLTRERLGRARRRLSELPAAALTALRYEPPRDGRSTVVAAVVEPPLLPTSPFAIGAALARAAVSGQATLSLASPTGGGDAWTPRWRWGDGRAGGGLSVALPAPAALGAVWRIDLERHEEVFAPITSPGFAVSGSEAQPSTVTVAEQPALAPQPEAVERTHAGLTIADWYGEDTRWEVSSGWDRWQAIGQHLSFGAAVERRWAADRLVLRLDGTAWTRVGAGRGAFVQTGASVEWRSTQDDITSPSTWHGAAGLHAVGGDAPRDLWPGAGQGELRAPLLRAHPLVEGGSIRPGGVGRTLLHGTLEYRRRLVQLGPVGLSAAVFGDVARTASPMADGPGPAAVQVDAGAGLRLRLPGQPGHLRLDVARGLRDGATSVSAGWILSPSGRPSR